MGINTHTHTEAPTYLSSDATDDFPLSNPIKHTLLDKGTLKFAKLSVHSHLYPSLRVFCTSSGSHSGSFTPSYTPWILKLRALPWVHYFPWSLSTSTYEWNKPQRSPSAPKTSITRQAILRVLGSHHCTKQMSFPSTGTQKLGGCFIIFLPAAPAIEKFLICICGMNNWDKIIFCYNY